MKKCLVLIVALAAFTALCAAQTVTGNTNYQAQYDVMGAHENGGRGCAGCHAPHSGGRGSGGNTMSNGSINAYGTGADGWGGLWGTDTTAITANYSTIVFNGNSHHTGTLTGISPSLNWNSSIYTGVVTCLSCHDGAVSKGAMMSGVAYEQVFGLLNGATYMGAGRNSALTTTLYGPNPIPTLLGADGATTLGTGIGGGYANDHPLGQTANLGAVLGTVLTNPSYGFSAAISPTATSLGLNAALLAAGTPYGDFAASYTVSAISSMVGAGDSVAGNFFIVCTTCHNQHNMAVYGGGHGQATVAGDKGNGRYRTIFFVNGPYNPGAPYDPQHIPSTMAFCQQCHFSMSSQYYGAGQAVGVAF